MARSILDWRPWLLLWSLQVPSLRALLKYLPESLHVLIPLYFVAAFAVYAWLVRTKSFRRLFNSRVLFVSLIALHVILNMTVYPYADALKFEGRGSPQDDALVVGGERLVQGLNPYEGETFKQEWVSAGPGWIVLSLPFVFAQAMELLSPVWVAVTAGCIALWFGLRLGTLFLILCFSAPVFWELSVTGSDMLAMGCAFLLVTIWSFRAWTRGGVVAKSFSALLSACVTSSRIVFGYLLALIAGFLLRKSSKSGFAYGFAAIGLFVLIQLPFYLWNPERYFPLTRFFWAKGMLGPTLEIVSLLTTAATLLYLALRTELSERMWIKGVLVSLLVTMFWSALGDLQANQFEFAVWEGANYFGPLIPAALTFVLLNITPRTTA
ncbi:hypothetical protein KJZ99_05240 [bacterium]|nr:hypothetical protein [bacterium]